MDFIKLDFDRLTHLGRKVKIFVAKGPAYHYIYGRWRLSRWLSQRRVETAPLDDSTFFGLLGLSKRGTKRRTIQHENVTAHYLPRVRWPSRLSIIGNIRQMQAELLRLKPDLVHAHIAGEYAEAAARTGLPWVLTLHGIRFLEATLRPGHANKYRCWYIKREELHAVKLAKFVISISPFVQDVFNGHLPDHVYNIENPISYSFFELPENGNPGQILFAGRLIRRKGVHTLLRAFAELYRRMPNATLRLAGGGAQSRAYTKDYFQQLKF